MSRWDRLVFFMGLLAACGGDDNSSTGVSTGLPAEQKLSTLDDAEVKQACERVNDAALTVFTPEVRLRVSCMSTGVQAGLTISGSEVSVDVNKCQKAVDTCVSTASDKDTDDDSYECEDANSAAVDNCDATVADYEGCFNGFLAQMKQKLSEFNCQNAEKLSSSEYSDDALSPKNVPVCASLMAKCPDAQLGLPGFD